MLPLGALTLGDVNHAPTVHRSLRIFVCGGTSHCPNMFDGTIGHHETMLNVKIAFLHRRAFKDLSQTHPVVLMTTVDSPLNGGLGHSFVFKNSICLVGPVDFPAQDVPAETARVAEPLRFHEIGLAP